MKKLKVLIVDDQKLFGDSLKTVLMGNGEIIEDVAIAMNGEEAVKSLHSQQVDIVLMDIHMPIMDGIEATKIIHRKYPDIKILMLTTYGYDEYVRDAIKNGAVGFLLKDISSDELISSIQGASNGLRIVSPEVVNGAYPPARETKGQKEIPDWYNYLTQREKEILIFVQQGFSNGEIAEKLFLSIQTVKNYLSSIYEKMEVKNRFQAMRLAMEFKVDTLHIR